MYVFVELSISSSVSHQWVCTSDAPLPSSGSRWPRFPPSAVLSERYDFLTSHVLRLIDFASRLRRRLPGFVFAGALPPPCRPGDGPGSGLFTLAVPFQRSCPRARAGSPRFPGGHPVTLRRPTTPDGPLRPANSGASGAAPTQSLPLWTALAATNRSDSCWARFAPARRKRLIHGARSRTRWIATRGFSSCHPPLQGLPWRNKRSLRPCCTELSTAVSSSNGSKWGRLGTPPHPRVGRFHGLAVFGAKI